MPPVVTGPELTQSEFRRSKVIDARSKAEQVLTHDVQLDLVKSAGAGRRAEEGFAARNFLALGDARREKKKLRQVFEGGDLVSLACNPWTRDCRQRRNAGLAEILWETRDLERGIDFEKKRLVLPVEKMRMHAHTRVRVLR